MSNALSQLTLNKHTMRIAILASGSRGDVQPYVALGKGLHDAGHDVRLVSHENYAGLAQSAGLPFRAMRGDVQAVAESPEMRALIEKGDFIAITRFQAQALKGAAVPSAQDALAACRDAELLLTGLGGLFNGLAIAEKLNLPLVQAYLTPMTPTRDFPSVLLPTSGPTVPKPLTRASHALTQQAIWQGVRAADTLAREQVLGLKPAPFFGPFGSPRLQQSPVLYGFSPSVIARPTDWEDRVHLTGYWFLQESSDWTPPPDLMAFLERGPAPVYIGFGSMGSRKPEETTDIVLRALAQTGQRAILSSGWGGLRADALPENVLMIGSVPHTWLFPRMATVVHHGGAGTTAAGLRAGAPSIVIPFFGDQPFWGQRVAALGVGPAPIPRQKLTADALAQAIQRATTDTTMQGKAAELGAKIRAEDGVARAVEIIAQHT
jgi:UDP:flavonoid glycosyltransferase YjiC (YdhE family)